MSLPSPLPEERFGFIGLGSMGAPMAKNLSNAVSMLRVFDIAGTDERAPEGTVCCHSLEEIIGSCDTIFLSLPDGKSVIQTAQEMVLIEEHSCNTLVDTSTIGVDAVKHVEPIVEKAKIVYLDCPVSGGQSGAQAGTLTFMGSGSESRSGLESCAAPRLQNGVDQEKLSLTGRHQFRMGRTMRNWRTPVRNGGEREKPGHTGS